jgi:signal transduction histidine kinase/ActR/RegA family two-component response regulator
MFIQRSEMGTMSNETQGIDAASAAYDNSSAGFAHGEDASKRLKGDEKYRLLFDRMLDGFALCELILDSSRKPVDFRYLEMNPAYERITGIKSVDAVGRTAREISPDIEGFWIDIFGEVALTGESTSFTAYFEPLDKHLEIQLFSPLRGQFAVIMEDITPRIRIEQVLRESEHREKARSAELAALMEAVPATVLIAHDPDCRLITGNLAACALLRMPPGGNLSKSAPEGERPVHYRIFRDGVETPPHDLPVQRAARGEEVRNYEQEFVFDDGSSRTLLGNATPLRDAEGRVCGAVSAFVDITERKNMEKEMQRSQKLESLGVLAGGIAHDFNNILTTILGNISLARMQISDGEKVAKRLKELENAAARAKELSQQLLTFARGGEPVKKKVEIGPLLREAAGFALRGSKVRCRFALDDGLCPVHADEGQLRQVVKNIVINAVESMPVGGTVAVGARNGGHTHDGTRCVEISIADTGSGISGEHLQKIFDPYYTTKDQGTGLGLSVCYSIIKKHGGTISVESAPGKGSTFFITLPVLNQAQKLEPMPAKDDNSGPVRILVMDDEEQVREILQDMLDELGYQSECTDDGAEAVELYRKSKEDGRPFSAVILDLTIPGGMGGKEAVKSLIEFDPDVNAVVSSGYSTDPIMASYREYGFRAVLGKPYRLQDLERVFHDILPPPAPPWAESPPPVRLSREIN